MKSILITSLLITIIQFVGKINIKPMITDTYICEEYQTYVEEISDTYNICPELVLAIIESESSGQANAYNDKYGCHGLMQIHRDSHLDRIERLGVTDLYDPYSNILVGVDYLSELFTEYESVASVLMHYHGESNVESKLSEGNISDYASSILRRSCELEMLRE